MGLILFIYFNMIQFHWNEKRHMNFSYLHKNAYSFMNIRGVNVFSMGFVEPRYMNEDESVASNLIFHPRCVRFLF